MLTKPVAAQLSVSLKSTYSARVARSETGPIRQITPGSGRRPLRAWKIRRESLGSESIAGRKKIDLEGRMIKDGLGIGRWSGGKLVYAVAINAEWPTRNRSVGCCSAAHEAF